MNFFRSSQVPTLLAACLTFGLGLASPATALTEDERCEARANRAEARYASCLAGVASHSAAGLRDATRQTDAHCAKQFTRRMAKLEQRVMTKNVGSSCAYRVSEDGKNQTQIELLIAAGRNPNDSAHRVEEDNAVLSSREISVREFREVMRAWAVATEDGYTTPDDNLASKIDALTDEDMRAWLSVFPNPGELVRSLKNSTDLTLNPAPARSRSSSQPKMNASSLGFTPDYPPPLGHAYQDQIDAILGNIGQISRGTDSPAIDRCVAEEWATHWDTWWNFYRAIDATEMLCVVASCDGFIPIISGATCLAVCGTYETAKLFLKRATRPLEACDAQQSAVDGAEIEAAYENSKTALGSLQSIKSSAADIQGSIDTTYTALTNHDSHIDSDLGQHDTDIRSQLANLKTAVTDHDAHMDSELGQHDTDIKSQLANLQAGVAANDNTLQLLVAQQLEIIRLLHTPEGERQTDIAGCQGEGCDWPNRPDSHGSGSD